MQRIPYRTKQRRKKKTRFFIGNESFVQRKIMSVEKLCPTNILFDEKLRPKHKIEKITNSIFWIMEFHFFHFMDKNISKQNSEVSLPFL